MYSSNENVYTQSASLSSVRHHSEAETRLHSEQLRVKLNDVLGQIQSVHAPCSFSKPLHPLKLCQWILGNELALPQEYVYFLKAHDGGTLFDDILQLYPLHSVLDNTESAKLLLSAKAKKSICIFIGNRAKNSGLYHLALCKDILH